MERNDLCVFIVVYPKGYTCPSDSSFPLCLNHSFHFHQFPLVHTFHIWLSLLKVIAQILPSKEVFSNFPETTSYFPLSRFHNISCGSRSPYTLPLRQLCVCIPTIVWAHRRTEAHSPLSPATCPNSLHIVEIHCREKVSLMTSKTNKNTFSLLTP